jgi:GGDEF domain-containing protein
LESRSALSRTTAAELLRAADLALYASKRSGKDRITIAPLHCS